MPLGRKQSAFRKTVSDLKSATGLFGAASSSASTAAGGGVGGRKRKLSEPGNDNSSAEVPAPAAAAGAGSRRQGSSALPRMGRSLANLASSIKKRGGGGGAHGNKRPRVMQQQQQQQPAEEEDNNNNNNEDDKAGDEDEDSGNDEGDDANGHDSTIFEEVKPQKKQQNQQPQQQPPTKKERRALKKKQKKNADLVSELLILWEELRVDATPASRVVELCDAALKLGRGKLAELAASHDTGRVLEALLKRGSEHQRWLVFEELKDRLLTLAKSKYGRFVAQKMLKYGSKEQRAFVLRSLEGRAPELLKHRFAAELVETAYNEFANAGQRASILQEFYGPELALFKSSSVSRLKDALTTRPGLVMQHLQQHLLALTQKDLVRHSLVQHLLLEYLEEALLPTSGSTDAAVSVLENLRDNLVPMLHTRDGTKAAMLVVRHLSHRDLKRALKSAKTFLCTAACNEHGYLFVIGLAERHCLTPEELHKLLLRELFDSLQELVDSQHGRKVLLYLLSPRDPLHFPPQLMSLIRPTPLEAGEAATTTELLRQRLHKSLQAAGCAGKLLSHVSGRMAELCQANATTLFVMDTLRHCPGEKSACYAALADLVRQPFTASQPEEKAQDDSKQHIIERSAGHLMLKRLLPTSPDLVRLVNDFVTDDNMASWLLCNRGSFFLLQLYENCPSDCNLRDRIGRLFRPERLRKSGYKGAQLLADKLQLPAAASADADAGAAVVADNSSSPQGQQPPPAKKSRRVAKK